MKKPLCLNKKLYKIDIFEQNKYLGSKLNSMKPIIKTNFQNIYYRNGLSKSSSKKQGMKFW